MVPGPWLTEAGWRMDDGGVVERFWREAASLLFPAIIFKFCARWFLVFEISVPHVHVGFRTWDA